MIILLIQVISLIVRIFVLMLIINMLLSFFVQPYHPVRMYLTRLLEPMLYPIRRYLPPTGMLDFSPLILLIFVQLLGNLLINLLVSFL
ncbi:MAG: YggT family protein [Anaerolineae bacterium]|nr:YggT family protein [Anaerolineae bacterium]